MRKTWVDDASEGASRAMPDGELEEVRGGMSAAGKLAFGQAAGFGRASRSGSVVRRARTAAAVTGGTATGVGAGGCTGSSCPAPQP